MAPSVAITSPEPERAPISLKSGMNGLNGTHADKKPAFADADVNEDYAGDYRFAPIEEAQVSRAMIKRCAPLTYPQ